MTTGEAETSRPSLRSGLQLTSRSPVTGFVATVAPEKLASRELDASTAASGPHDFAVRIMHVRLARKSRPPLPAPNVRDDREVPLMWARDGVSFSFDLPDGESGKFFAEGLDDPNCLRNFGPR
jgi:hypothetical protein